FSCSTSALIAKPAQCQAAMGSWLKELRTGSSHQQRQDQTSWKTSVKRSYLQDCNKNPAEGQGQSG
ncbi:hypothetical protein, partial [Xanthomonas oryzae]|uniref:hypothetical protein n=1 Tax=Xanthomonas oryzae TaxID=347 RepID=UPI001C49D714